MFHPKPKVNSAILRLDPMPGRQADLARLTPVVRALFNYRRKTIGKAAKLAAQADPALAWQEVRRRLERLRRARGVVPPGTGMPVAR